MRAPLNESRVLLTSAQRTATTDSGAQDNQYWRGGHFIVNVTDVGAATPSITATIQGFDPVAGEWYDILASASLSTVARTVLKVYPGLTAAANSVGNDVLPGKWRVNVAHADADAITYSVVAHLVR